MVNTDLIVDRARATRRELCALLMLLIIANGCSAQDYRGIDFQVRQNTLNAGVDIERIHFVYGSTITSSKKQPDADANGDIYLGSLIKKNIDCFLVVDLSERGKAIGSEIYHLTPVDLADVARTETWRNPSRSSTSSDNVDLKLLGKFARFESTSSDKFRTKVRFSIKRR
ncbi:hypothetical protein [Allorhodopirellula solitaria]|uniref:Uncharacterized protein n=1 Tax=Allorhodopirellula solitaria TaxID=2527987 RepID=A0A5C5WNB4_9BACT|nr:hypothetical protein [Allorhodopirellula solitaria]TWT51675.1 hypothetical protein CA85_52060 [Allorhodopirellula solitaria]